MPRKIEEELVGVAFAVRKTQAPVTDEQGKAVHENGSGEPKMRDVWILDLVDQSPFELRVLHVPLSEENRDELVRQLTGGIQLAAAMPRGLSI